MTNNLFINLDRLSDDELLRRVESLARSERRTTAALVAHLAVMDERRLHLGQGCSSLFTYCTQVLHFSEHSAYNRIEAARICRRFPVILEHLADGSLHLSAVRLLAPHLTPENIDQVLGDATHCSKREVEDLVARLKPRPPVPALVRKLPTLEVQNKTEGNVAAGAFFSEGIAAASDSLKSPGHDTPIERNPDFPIGDSGPSSSKPAAVKPLAPRRYRIQFTADEETERLLREAQELLRHQVPNGEIAAVFHLALKCLVSRLMKQKFGFRTRGETRAEARHGAMSVERLNSRHEAKDRSHFLAEDHLTPQPSSDKKPSRSSSRHIPASVRRQVWTRDGGRCAFTTPDGRRCLERGRLEFHHLEPYAWGGQATADNLSLRCRAHNQYDAELCFRRNGTQRE